MPTIQLAGDVEIHYQVDDFTDPWASSETVVFVHGLAESGEAWRAWVPHFAGNYRVVRIDLRGFGASTPMPAQFEWSIDILSEDLAALAARLELDSFHLVGAKLGGIVSMKFAAAYSDRVKTLAVVGAPASTHRSVAPQVPGWVTTLKSEGVLGWARATMRDRLGSEMPAVAQEWWATMMARTARSSLEGILRAVPGFDVEHDLAGIRCPTLVITSTGSRLGTVGDTEDWRARIRRSELLVLDTDSYHVAVSHPRQCAQAVLSFIDTHSSAGSSEVPA